MTLSPYTPQTKGELLEVHSSVFLFAPDNFGELPGLRPEDQRTLEGAYAELRRGVDHVFRKPRHEPLRKQLHEALAVSYAHFKRGDQNAGRLACHKVEDLLRASRP